VKYQRNPLINQIQLKEKSVIAMTATIITLPKEDV
jgi:hypothetical protein